jgi:peptidyl-prolyl cis-trans isomerase SurA
LSAVRLRTLAGLALASTLLLTGCGSVPAFNPGVAARVDGDTISLGRVDDVATSYCDAAEKQLQAGQVLPMHYLRGRVAGSLALRVAADRFAAAHGVSADSAYDTAVRNAQSQLAGLPEDQRQALIDVQGAAIYVQAVEKSVGASLGATGSEKAQVAAGQKAFQKWLDDQDIRLDPRFGVSIADGEVKPVDTSVSYPLGATAKSADADQPDTTYAGGLPETQRCG